MNTIVLIFIPGSAVNLRKNIFSLCRVFFKLALNFHLLTGLGGAVLKREILSIQLRAFDHGDFTMLHCSCFQGHPHQK